MSVMRPTRKIVTFLLLPLVLLLVVVGLCVACRGGGVEGGQKYHCPMHPEYVADKPGDCPICGMRLVPMEKKKASKQVPDGKGTSERKVLFYRHPMNPTITSPVPAKDEMGMDYVPVYTDETHPDTSRVPGLAKVEVGESALRLAGVQTAAAVRDTLTRTTRTVGLVTPDETRVRHVHTKISGWIEKLHINYTGQVVRAGQPLLAIYSPELLASQEEYLRARAAADRFAASALPEVRSGGEDLLRSARRRLELFDVPRNFIETLDRTGKPQRTVTLLAPVSGYVTGKEIFEGMQVEPSMDLLTITDLSRVWVEADFYEYESRSLRLGQRVALLLPYDTRMHLVGRISFISPMLNSESRTVKARLEFPNRDLALKPGMYVDVAPDLEAREGVVIPDSAVIDTGVRQVVFIERAGVFEPREVRVGARSDGRALILDGVQAGERVAVRANFLLDSESRLRAAIAGMKSSPAPDGGAR